MTELEIMQRAKQYIDSLANGIDPLSGIPAKEDDVINQVRISRCLFYVSGVLQKVIDNGGEVQKKRTPREKKPPFFISEEQIAQLKPHSSPVSASKITAAVNAVTETENMQKLKATDVIGWLLSIGLLTETENEYGKKRKIPTPDGEQLGMREASFVNEQGMPTQYTVYDKNAQQFIFDNLGAVMAFIRESADEESAANSAQ